MKKTVFQLPAQLANDLFEIADGNDLETTYDGRTLKNPATHYIASEARSGRIPSKLLLTDSKTGQVFAADYTTAADDNWYIERPFYENAEASVVDFYEVTLRTETVVVEHWDTVE